MILSTAGARAEMARLHVDTANPGHAVSPLLWGIFFEDINLSTDGGIYPERVRNRSFEDSDKPEHWTAAGPAGIAVSSESPVSEKNPRSLRVTATDAGGGAVNEGYWGMAVVKGERYRLSLYARGLTNAYTGTSLPRTASTIRSAASMRPPGVSRSRYMAAAPAALASWMPRAR